MIQLVEKIILDYGAIQRKHLFDVIFKNFQQLPGIPLKEHTAYKQLNNAIKKLVKKKIIYNSKGWYHVVTPVDGGPNEPAFNETPNESLYRWLREDTPQFFHNIQGKIIVDSWGKMNKDIIIKEPVKGTNGYIKLHKQSRSLQFNLSMSRPGFTRSEILTGFHTIYTELIKYGVLGEIKVQQFEIRNERDDIVHYLRRVQNPVQVKLLEDLIARAYYDPKTEKTNFELRSIVEWSIPQFINTINQMGVGAAYTTYVNNLGQLAGGIYERSRVAANQINDMQQRTLDYNIETQYELRKIQDEFLSNGFTVENAAANTSLVLEQVESINSEVSKLGQQGGPTESKFDEAMLMLAQNLTSLTDEVKKLKVSPGPTERDHSKETYLLHEYGIEDQKEPQTQQILKVMKVIRTATSDQVHNILDHLLLTSVRRCLSDLSRKAKLTVTYTKVNGKRLATYSIKEQVK